MPLDKLRQRRTRKRPDRATNEPARNGADRFARVVLRELARALDHCLPAAAKNALDNLGVLSPERLTRDVASELAQNARLLPDRAKYRRLGAERCRCPGERRALCRRPRTRLE